MLARLDEYLVQFEAAVVAAGGHVHWAREGEEANAIVLDIVRAHGGGEVVKMKSLTTDEIELNAALARAGIEALETDFAELILQLDGDWPSHILVPAIHRNRTEIRDLFARTIAPGLTSDEPAALAEAARRYLRERFLEARVGVSGANFGVAETGTLCIVESEGNGRMCTTLPPVLVSVLGIEKLVPTFADLEVFLQLLPRSSTGERMNPYTSMWTGVHEGDGPEELHVVLLDNGRTRVLADEVGRQALHCIRCSACLNVCPVYSRTGGHAYGSVYPGPDRRDPHAAAGRDRERALAAVRLDPLRRLLRGLPGEDRHPRRPAASARTGGPRPRPLERAGRDARRGVDVLLAPADGGGAVARTDRAAPAGARGLDSPSAWTARRLDANAGSAADRAPQLPRAKAAGARMSAAREEVLSRVRAALRGGADAVSEPGLGRGYRRRGELPRGELVGLFCDRVADYQAEARRCSLPDLPEAVRTACAEHRGRRMVVPAGLPGELRPHGVELIEDRELDARELDAADGVITGCTVAIAQTGTIALAGGPSEGRRAITLVPDLHVCVVLESQIVELVPEAIERLGAALARERRPVTLISGPSATSDIELARVEGVHGPRRLVVIVAG